MKLLDFDKQYGLVIGIDEAGRGPLAGPVVAAAVYIKQYSDDLSLVNDSKKLSEKKRDMLYTKILENSFVGVGIVDSNEIDQINILNATMKAMKLAVQNLYASAPEILVDLILVDGNMVIKNLDLKQKAIIQGDSKSLAIAAASIIAKVTRDNIMKELHTKYPQYLFDKHKGYGTKDHIDNIRKYGLSEVHRKSFLTKII